jgi:hypothetical protein
LTLAELPMPVQGYILWDVARFPRGSVKTHHPCAIHPFSTDEGKPHMTPWGWGVGPRSSTYSETDLPQGQVPGYPPPADVPGSHSSFGIMHFILHLLPTSRLQRIFPTSVHFSVRLTHHDRTVFTKSSSSVSMLRPFR